MASLVSFTFQATFLLSVTTHGHLILESQGLQDFRDGTAVGLGNADEHFRVRTTFLLLRREQGMVVFHCHCRMKKVFLLDLAGDVLTLEPLDGSDLTPFENFPNVGGDLVLQHRSQLVVVRLCGKQSPSVVLDQTDSSLLVGRFDLHQGIEPTHTQHGRVDGFQVIGGQNRDALVPLAVHTVETVEDFVHAGCAFTIDGPVDVLSKKDTGPY